MRQSPKQHTIRRFKMKIEKKQIVLFVVLMTWPLVPFIISKMFSKNVITAAEQGLNALGALV